MRQGPPQVNGLETATFNRPSSMVLPPPPFNHSRQKQILVCALPVFEAYIGNLQENSCL